MFDEVRSWCVAEVSVGLQPVREPDLGQPGSFGFGREAPEECQADRDVDDPETPAGRAGVAGVVVDADHGLGGDDELVTSLGGFITLPVALPVNLLGFYLLATRMTAAVARVRGHDIRSEQIRTAVLLTLVGAEADDLLRKANMVVPGGTLSNLAAQRLPGPALMVVQKAIGFRLLAQVGKSTFARLGRLVPIIGGAIGGGLDAYMLHRFSMNAKRQFPTAAPAAQLESGQAG